MNSANKIQNEKLISQRHHGMDGAEQNQRERKRDVQQQPAVQPEMQMGLPGELAFLFANTFQVLDRRVKRSRRQRSQLRECAARLRRVAQSTPARAGLFEKRLEFPF